jgi:uncharacterized protein (DUF1697 family)
MVLAVFLRGVNVGGHRRFRPSVLARELSAYEVVNVGAAGTFVARKPGSRSKFRAALLQELPFETEVVICDGRELLRLETENPFGGRIGAEVVRFVTIRSRAGELRSDLPIALPAEGRWLVRVIEERKQFVFGEYRRDMKTIGYLGKLDQMFGGRGTTRNWNTILAVVEILKGSGKRSG